MNMLDRRSVLALGTGAAVATPMSLLSTPAAAQYGPDEGEEVAPGVRIIELSEMHGHIPAYARVSMRDAVFQPGSRIEAPAMENDMVCHMLEGELYIDNGDGDEFTAGPNQVWSCRKGQPETSVNNTDSVAIMRIIDLHEA